jgi:hypothetical protein
LLTALPLLSNWTLFVDPLRLSGVCANDSAEDNTAIVTARLRAYFIALSRYRRLRRGSDWDDK